jgi:hypothetical protein
LGQKQYPKALAQYDKALLGAKGITYLLYVGREVNTVDVVNLLVESKIIRNKDVAYVYTNELEKGRFIRTTKTLPSPGPPKIRVAKLEPILQTIEFYRRWQFYLEDERQLTLEKKQRIIAFFQNVSSLRRYFPHYLHLHLSFPNEEKPKLVKMLEWTETLSIFIEFCLRILETCWQINEHSGLKGDQKISELLGDIGSAPFGYIYDAHKKGKLTAEAIAEIARFSFNGHKDIYRESFLRELYYSFISLRNPLAAGSLVQRSEEMLSSLLEGQLEDISVGSLYRAINDRAMKEFQQIEREMKARFADHEARDEALQKLLKCKPEDVPKALDAMIKKFRLGTSREGLMKALVDVELARLLKGRAAQLEPILKSKGP